MRNFFSENFSVSDSARKILTESLKFRCLSPTLGKKSQKWGAEQGLFICIPTLESEEKVCNTLL